VTATLWSGVRAWLIGAALYLPEAWLTDRGRCEKARISMTVVFQKKWELALGLLRDALAAGFQVAAVLADAGYGDVAAFRAALHELALAYAVGMLKRGERESVARFLDRYARINLTQRDRLTASAAAIRAGRMPDFYQYQVTPR
jgi:hypothetical protein